MGGFPAPSATLQARGSLRSASCTAPKQESIKPRAEPGDAVKDELPAEQVHNDAKRERPGRDRRRDDGDPRLSIAGVQGQQVQLPNLPAVAVTVTSCPYGGGCR